MLLIRECGFLVARDLVWDNTPELPCPALLCPTEAAEQWGAQ